MTTHGMRGTKPYRAWVDMKTRCFNKNSNGYKNYGGRGIGVCKEWVDSFVNFWDDMGPTYKDKLTLERINNNKGYSLDNCTWASWDEQANNRRNNKVIKYGRCEMTVAQWAKAKKIRPKTLWARLYTYNLSIVRALTK